MLVGYRSEQRSMSTIDSNQTQICQRMISLRLLVATLIMGVLLVSAAEKAWATRAVICDEPDDGTGETGVFEPDLVWIHDRDCDHDGICVALIHGKNSHEGRQLLSVSLVVGDFDNPQLLVPLRFEVKDEVVLADVVWHSPEFDDASVWVTYEHRNGCMLYSRVSLGHDAEN